jgi:hypothetical protein
MTWATAVFVSRSGAWIVAQQEDGSIVFELVGEEGSIQVCDQIKANWGLKGGQKISVNRLRRTVDAYVEGRFGSVRIAVQKAKEWSGEWQPT